MNARELCRRLELGALRPVALLGARLAPLVAGVVVQTAPAEACSVGIGRILQSYPTYEATGVPTNVVPILYTDGSFDTVLLRGADGTPVAAEITREDPDGFVLRPLRELEPLADYELEYGTVHLAFQTGEGPAPVADELAVPDISATRVSHPTGGNCGMKEFVCAAAASEGLLFELRVGGDIMLSDRITDASQLLKLEPVLGSFQSPDECLDVYARDVRGRRSSPLTLCGDEVAVVEIGELPSLSTSIGCDEAVAIAEGEVPNYPRPSPPVVVHAIDSGCRLSPAARQSAAGAALFGSALGLLVARLKRRRARR
jgi:hypothetical protein